MTMSQLNSKPAEQYNGICNDDGGILSFNVTEKSKDLHIYLGIFRLKSDDNIQL